MVQSPLAVSAPGKVLFTGGFLVLDRKHRGLVLGLDARIHVHIKQWDGERDLKLDNAMPLVLVHSPQFQNANWLYRINESAVDTAAFVQQITG